MDVCARTCVTCGGRTGGQSACVCAAGESGLSRVCGVRVCGVRACGVRVCVCVDVCVCQCMCMCLCHVSVSMSVCACRGESRGLSKSSVACLARGVLV